jgi:hypothetical protein
MDFFALLTDPKVLLIIAVLALLVALGIYTWRQYGHMEELKIKNDKMLEQVKHGVLLSEQSGEAAGKARLRGDMASNMSEETNPGVVPEESEMSAYDADADAEDEDKVHPEWEDDCSDEEHTQYIKELIRINDSKRAKRDEYYVKTQQQSGHHGPVYDSGEEEMIFDNYADTDDASNMEILAHVRRELELANSSKISSPVPPPQVPQQPVLQAQPQAPQQQTSQANVPQLVSVVGEITNITAEKPKSLSSLEVKKPKCGRPRKVKETAVPLPEEVKIQVKEENTVKEEIKEENSVKEEIKEENAVKSKIKLTIGKKSA